LPDKQNKKGLKMGKTYQSIVVNSPVEQVWNTIKNFHDGSWAPKVIQKLDVVGDKAGNEIGAQRLLNGVFAETLQEVNEDAHSFKYSIDNGPVPVSVDDVQNYIGHVALTSATLSDATLVEWSSSWKDGKSDETAEFCHGIYVALLKSLKESCES
jgi:hypothetical protein